MNTLRVLHVVANRWWTGSGAPALDLARALRDRGHDVSFACAGGGALETKARAAGLSPVVGLSLERTARPWTLVAEARALRRLVCERSIEIVHTHLSHDHWLAALSLRGMPVGLVRTVHHRRALRRRPGVAWLLTQTHALVAPSQGIAAAARARGVPPERVTVIAGAVDVERFSPTADGRSVRAALGVGEAPVVGTVARLVPGRGHDLLMQAAARLRARWPALRVLLVGRGEGRPALERLVSDHRLESTVLFTGYRGDDLPQVLAAMDCFVLLGAGSEESCRAVLEAMAAARPVVAARVGALPETVVDGETGWLVDGSPDAIVQRLDAILTDPDRARAMGVAGRRRVEGLFTPERRAISIEGVYTSVLGGFGR